MFDHVTIRVSDRAASAAFYTLALGEPTAEDEWGDFSLLADEAVTRRLHVAWGLEDRAAVDAWWRRMTEGGYASDGEPGERPQYSPDYYGAFVLDPDGNSVEALHHERSAPGELSHLWLRTRDLEAAARFYETVAPVVAIRPRRLVAPEGVALPEGVQFRFAQGSFSFVAGDEPTENVHLAFGVPDQATVKAFHRVALAAGYRDNGPPGERPRYHPGYYGAFVLDPDGHNVEAVFHHRPPF